MIKKSVVGRVDALLKTDLFSSVGKEKLIPICENYCQNKTFQKGKTIFSKNTSEKCIGIIADGTASVKKERVVINHLKAGDIFGAVTLYNDCDRFVNDIVAQTECTVIFISKDGIDSLLSKQLNISRASLYRAIDELYDSKKIGKDGNIIRLL